MKCKNCRSFKLIKLPLGYWFCKTDLSIFKTKKVFV
jgi:hypothetical protein